jgi:hypothetical protein
MAGGPWWLLAALAASLATYSKLIGLGLLPLLLLGGWGYEGDRKWRGSALALYLVSLAPLVLWNLEHDWVNIQFQFREGLYHPHPPGGFGMVFQQLDQIGVVTPLTYLAVLIWGARKVWLVRAGEPLGLPWWSSVPVVCFFFICSPFAPSEAHWPAVAYVSAGFGLAQAKGKLRRLMDTGLGLGLAATAVLVSHGLFPWLPLWKDPGTRLTEGLVLADRVAHWAAPEGTSIGHWNGEGAPQIFTERYQEAALITYYTPLVAHKFPGCGRIDYYDKLEVTRSSKALFVRPTTSGYDTCLDDHYASRSSPNRTQGIDDANRLVGQWDIIEYEQPK